MFTAARVKLTAWYLAIIMAISVSFSLVIFAGIDKELVRFDTLQKIRQQKVNEINLFLRSNGIWVPEEESADENETLEAARLRIISAFGFINLSILVIAGAGGYFLAGRTLEPLQKNMEDQKSFVSDASHELRTPLTTLKTEIEVALRDKKLTLKDARNLLKSNLEEVDNMQKLAGYLLRLNRFEASKKLKLSKIDLKDVALKAVGDRKIKTELQNTKINGNFDSLVELAKILLDNAVKYGEGKEITIKTGKNKISVKDRGVGIAEKDLPRIFDRFYRSDKSRGTEGYGLGLSIAKSIAEANGAVIKVKSKPGSGSTFTVIF